MSHTIDITPAADTVKLSPSDEGTLVRFTATNTSDQRVRGRAVVVAPASEQTSWYELETRPEVEIDPGVSKQFDVRIKPDVEMKPGDYTFRLDMVMADVTDEVIGEGQPVAFKVKGSDPTPTKFPWWIVAVAAAVLLVVGGVVTWLLIPGNVTVPTVLGVSLTDARQTIEEAGLVLEVSGEPGEDPALVVLEQDPAPEESLGKGETVTVSAGLPEVAVPRLAGLERDAALQAIEDANLLVGTVSVVRKNPNRAGKVLEQMPGDGETVAIGTEISMEIEAALVRVTDVVGNSGTEAEQVLRDAGLAVAATVVTRDASRAGQVLEQAPAANALVQEGDTITLTIEAGRFSVPTVIGLGKAQAEQALAGDGWTVKWLAPQPSLERRPGEVKSQQPGPNVQVTEKGVVSLVPAGPTVQVPTLAGKSKDQIEAALRRLELKPSFRNVFSSSTPVGTPIALNPPPGTPLLHGSTVRVDVASLKFVPVIRRSDKALEAAKAIDRSRLRKN